jgi:hypothetical protein
MIRSTKPKVLTIYLIPATHDQQSSKICQLTCMPLDTLRQGNIIPLLSTLQLLIRTF